MNEIDQIVKQEVSGGIKLLQKLNYWKRMNYLPLWNKLEFSFQSQQTLNKHMEIC